MADPKQPLNALMPIDLPAHFHSLDYAIENLVRKHGADAVREATRRLARKKTGRKQEQDLSLLEDWFNDDAVEWLDGGDPFKRRRNYAMAKRVASMGPPHNHQAAYRRTMGKLSKRRHSITIIIAWQIAEKSRPFGDYFRASDALIAIKPKLREVVESIADTARGKIERYKQRFGQIDPAMTLPQIEQALMTPIPPKLNETIAGLLGTRKP